MPVCMCGYACTCVHVRDGGQVRSWVQTSSSCRSLLSFLRQGLTWIQDFLIWLVNMPIGSHLHLLSRDHAHLVFTWVLGIWTLGFMLAWHKFYPQSHLPRSLSFFHGAKKRLTTQLKVLWSTWTLDQMSRLSAGPLCSMATKPCWTDRPGAKWD